MSCSAASFGSLGCSCHCRDTWPVQVLSTGTSRTPCRVADISASNRPGLRLPAAFVKKDVTEKLSSTMVYGRLTAGGGRSHTCHAHSGSQDYQVLIDEYCASLSQYRQLQRQLQPWISDFRRTHKRDPTLQDALLAHATVSAPNAQVGQTIGAPPASAQPANSGDIPHAQHHPAPGGSACLPVLFQEYSQLRQRLWVDLPKLRTKVAELTDGLGPMQKFKQKGPAATPQNSSVSGWLHARQYKQQLANGGTTAQLPVTSNVHDNDIEHKDVPDAVPEWIQALGFADQVLADDDQKGTISSVSGIEEPEQYWLDRVIHKTVDQTEEVDRLLLQGTDMTAISGTSRQVTEGVQSSWTERVLQSTANSPNHLNAASQMGARVPQSSDAVLPQERPSPALSETTMLTPSSSAPLVPSPKAKLQTAAVPAADTVSSLVRGRTQADTSHAPPASHNAVASLDSVKMHTPESQSPEFSCTSTADISTHPKLSSPQADPALLSVNYSNSKPYTATSSQAATPSSAEATATKLTAGASEIHQQEAMAAAVTTAQGRMRAALLAALQYKQQKSTTVASDSVATSLEPVSVPETTTDSDMAVVEQAKFEVFSNRVRKGNELPEQFLVCP